MQVVVYKLGGSLLDFADLPARLTELVASRPAHLPIFVCGGGASADIVRAWDKLHDLGEKRAHWLAIAALGFNDALLRQLFPSMQSVATREEAVAVHAQGRWPLVDSHAFLSRDDAGDALPHNWNVTSDSIAARVARCWQADELVLVKSTDLPESCTLRDAQHSGLVDAYFDRAARDVAALSWVNLRVEPLHLQRWL
jgi:aspartokinase-like uncharacterized kinase